MMEDSEIELRYLLGAYDNESRIENFYRSGDPKTSRNHPLHDYSYPLTHKESTSGEHGIFLGVDAPSGQILLVENTEVLCACARDCVTNDECSSAHAPTTVGTPPSCRIPPNTHEHLADKLAELIRIGDGTAASGDSENEWIQYLDASRVSSGVLPNLGDTVDGSLAPKNRGRPWLKTAAGGRKLNFDRVLNIIANNAICEKVRVTAGEDSSKTVETCELYGLWPQSSFINHSCDPNCHGKVIGNAIIVRATVAMVSGDELTLPYFDIFEPLLNRELATEKWGFRCTCARCAFERTLGKPYDDIQTIIVNLKQQLQSAWTLMNDMSILKRVREWARGLLLEKLAAQIFPTEELMKECWLKDLVQISKDRRVPLDTCDILEAKEMNWIKASLLLDPLIALYALCSAGSVADSFRDFFPPPNFPSKRRTEEAMDRWRENYSILLILTVLNSFHPGNLLSQEFCSIFRKAAAEFVACDYRENLDVNRTYQAWCTKQGIASSLSYYGKHLDREVMEEVLMAPGY